MTKLDEREKQLKENTKRNEDYLKMFDDNVNIILYKKWKISMYKKWNMNSYY